MTPHGPKTDPRRYDAIHRALLAGLLSNVGLKGDSHDYAGARGKKFNLFPGSALFRKEPRWVMAAELVETTKLYARCNAGIDPLWIERIADHLLNRSYSDPHWNPTTAHVVAFEKVTLYGLVIVAQRTVHYGPIDPRISREIFLKAIVDGEYRTDAPWFRHNLKLVEEIEAIEAKARTRGVLVDPQARFDFYNLRIPAGIYNGPLFEKWRRETERQNPRILFMSRRDLMAHQAHGVTAQLFPDHLTLAGVTLPLEYHMEVGHVADGVTATIPLPLLSQLPTEPFEWLVPGLLREKIVALIKSLPKDLRVNFVPAPDIAEQIYTALTPYEGSLLEALSLHLGKLRGVRVPVSAFDSATLLDHLHMNFKVTDQGGKQLAMGRNLDAIRRQLGLQVRATFSGLAHPQFHRDNIVQWDFGDLPEFVMVNRQGMALKAYPALVEQAPAKPASAVREQSARSASPAHSRPAPPHPAPVMLTNPNLLIETRGRSKSGTSTLKSEISNPISQISVSNQQPATSNQQLPTGNYSPISLRLFESAEAAQASHINGLRRLFALHLRDELRYLTSTLDGFQQMVLHYAPLGSRQQLIDDICGETLNRAFLYDANVRTPMEFELRKSAGRRHKLLDTGREVGALMARILEEYHHVALALDKPTIPVFTPTLSDVRRHVSQLLPPGFLTSTPDEWLLHFPRFLKGMKLRLDKLVTVGHTRDQQKMAEVQPFLDLYDRQRRINQSQNVIDPTLDAFRWMIEEFRVSLFAQELKTSMTISAKRLEKQWEAVRR